jgi:hypothetical protein
VNARPQSGSPRANQTEPTANGVACRAAELGFHLNIAIGGPARLVRRREGDWTFVAILLPPGHVHGLDGHGAGRVSRTDAVAAPSDAGFAYLSSRTPGIHD